MRFISTRDDKLKENTYTAIVRGLAADGGLLMPATVKKFSQQELEKIYAYVKYQDVCADVMHALLGDFSQSDLRGFARLAYASFDSANPAPVQKLEGNLFALELWHGPTGAFKDMALQMLPRMLPRAKLSMGDSSLSLAVTATSGDTGGAAMNGFSDVEGTAVLAAFPVDGVSPIQKLQMCSCIGKNVCAVGIKGNFDDAQRGLKELFADTEFANKLGERNISLTTANSINWGRISAQVPYYFWAYAQMLARGIVAPSEEISFVVPTGNFGDILAGYYAKLLGLPVRRLVCATNSNNVLCEFIQNGHYNARRTLLKTTAPSMDIIRSSNTERLLRLVCKNSARVQQLMMQLQENSEYTLAEAERAAVSAVFSACSADNGQIAENINYCWRELHYLCDPHTAAAVHAARTYKGEGKLVVLSTATPYKFPNAVLSAIANTRADIGEFRAVAQLNELTKIDVPFCVEQLNKAEIRFNEVYSPKGMKGAVSALAAKL